MDHRTEIIALIDRVKDWPQEDRVALAYQILRDMRHEPLAPPPRHTLEEAIGSARGGGEIPNDQQVKQWLEEERWQKFGH